jgi:Leucine-rich repeat (LRR) protein
VSRETSTQIVKQLIQKVLGRNVHIEQFSSRFLYSFQCDKQILVEQNEKYGWGFNWSEKHLPCCGFDSQDRLTGFYCRQIQTKRINMNLFTELCILQCFNSPIAQLDVSQCTQLQQLYCDHTQIKELDVSQCTQLQRLFCYNTQLKELDVRQCTQLQTLSCYNTQIKELDVSQCTQLIRLYCSNSPIEELGLDKCTQLQYLNCSNTQIQKLDVTECSRLEDVFIGKCRNLETVYCLRKVQIHNKPKQTVVYLI